MDFRTCNANQEDPLHYVASLAERLRGVMNDIEVFSVRSSKLCNLVQLVSERLQDLCEAETLRQELEEILQGLLRRLSQIVAIEGIDWRDNQPELAFIIQYVKSCQYFEEIYISHERLARIVTPLLQNEGNTLDTIIVTMDDDHEDYSQDSTYFSNAIVAARRNFPALQDEFIGLQTFGKNVNDFGRDLTQRHIRLLRATSKILGKLAFIIAPYVATDCNTGGLSFERSRDVPMQGSFGFAISSVWRGQYVVLRKTQPQHPLMNDLDLLYAAQSWQVIRHPNIVQLYGTCILENNVNLITERCHQSLQNLLYNYNASLSLDQEDTIIKGIVRGLKHLHSLYIVHGNIQPESVLLVDGSNGNIKLTDIGIAPAKLTDKTYRYAAPELYSSPLRWSRASDIFSLGILCWEIKECQPPWGAENRNVIQNHVLKNRRPQFGHDTEWKSHFQELVTKMWASEAASRPTAKTIFDCVSSNIKNRRSSRVLAGILLSHRRSPEHRKSGKETVRWSISTFEEDENLENELDSPQRIHASHTERPVMEITNGQETFSMYETEERPFDNYDENYGENSVTSFQTPSLREEANYRNEEGLRPSQVSHDGLSETSTRSSLVNIQDQWNKICSILSQLRLDSCAPLLEQAELTTFASFADCSAQDLKEYGFHKFSDRVAFLSAVQGNEASHSSSEDDSYDDDDDFDSDIQNEERYDELHYLFPSITDMETDKELQELTELLSTIHQEHHARDIYRESGSLQECRNLTHQQLRTIGIRNFADRHSILTTLSQSEFTTDDDLTLEDFLSSINMSMYTQQLQQHGYRKISDCKRLAFCDDDSPEVESISLEDRSRIVLAAKEHRLPAERPPIVIGSFVKLNACHSRIPFHHTGEVIHIEEPGRAILVKFEVGNSTLEEYLPREHLVTTTKPTSRFYTKPLLVW
eukprot:CAMPEP_0171589352 /NCGR_PEP_ID=MMETSP0961-20121227/14791_1 /TAXON_ID=87120 /ORGANISM="Aurantiochytrium limacinum, Strain ATCCMYA-1381" /LENGTH=926 /DNA_ID=CAMNT_0012148621 /DNA_START=90 /DNA_END=2867 /DNA_ORIENTATION=+